MQVIEMHWLLAILTNRTIIEEGSAGGKVDKLHQKIIYSSSILFKWLSELY
jgi:hypothetical protein